MTKNQLIEIKIDDNNVMALVNKIIRIKAAAPAAATFGYVYLVCIQDITPR